MLVKKKWKSNKIPLHTSFNGQNTECWKPQILIHCWWQWKTTSTLGSVLWFLTKVSLLLPHQPAVMFLGICPKELKTRPHKTWAQTFKQLSSELPKLGSNQGIPQWANKLWSIQAMEYYSAPKRNELLSHQKTGRKLKCVLLSGRSQYQKSIHCNATVGHSIKEVSKRPVVARGCGEEWIYKVIEGF